jgi:solute carrier family 35, member F5
VSGIVLFRVVRASGCGCRILGAVFTAIASQSGSEQAANEWWGVMLSLLSAAAYGCYTVIIRVSVPEEKTTFNLRMMFGFIGVFNLIFLAPVVLVLHATNVEPLNNLTPWIFSLMLIKGLFDNVLSDLMWATAVLLTTPTVATVGLTLTIPMALASDAIVKGLSPSPMLIVGACVVVVGFVMSTIGGDKAVIAREERVALHHLEEEKHSSPQGIEVAMIEDSPAESHTTYRGMA